MKKEITLPMTSQFFKHADSKKERSIFLFDQLSLITVHRCLPLIKIINYFFCTGRIWYSSESQIFFLRQLTKSFISTFVD